jgi:uncharacterized protein (TIGR03086 family)
MSGNEIHPLIASAGAEIVRVSHGVSEDALSAATPCHDYDVRRLLNHLLYWPPIFELAAGKQPVPSDRPAEGEHDLTEGDWQTVMAQQVERLATAWADPAAWEGMTSIGRSDVGELPASMVGSLVLQEFTIHGWDLARGTRQSFNCDDDVALAVLTHLGHTVEGGRTMGAFGPEVAVPTDAPLLHHVLGLSGRDPNWSPTPAR